MLLGWRRTKKRERREHFKEETRLNQGGQEGGREGGREGLPCGDDEDVLVGHLVGAVDTLGENEAVRLPVPERGEGGREESKEGTGEY